MTGTNSAFSSQKLAQMWRESAQRSSSLHQQILQMRENGLRDMQSIIAMQIHSMNGEQVFPTTPVRPQPVLFDSRQLDAFGTGRISDCLGPAFSGYDQRRIPRIPNGDLKMMSRVTAIQGQPRDFNRSASITVAYDVPVDAWYMRDNAYPDIPWSLWMEIALQPCGFLSAYLDTYASVPYGGFYFRNLDGSMRWLAPVMDFRGQTIITQARLLSHIASGATVVQKFAFELSCNGQPICQGESLFGYFSAESMISQVGLDGGRQVTPWVRTAAYLGQPGLIWNSVRQPAPQPDTPHFQLSHGQLNLLDDIFVLPDGGQHGLGYVYASRPINPHDWFYPFHFYQDPVMPGSLGVEAIVQALQAYTLASDLGQGFHSPRFGLAGSTAPLTWRYRGQITPQNQVMELEAHVTGIQQDMGRTAVLADANLWVDGLRIYEVKNLAVGILEATI